MLFCSLTNRANAVGTCNNVVVLSSGQRRGGGVQATVIQPGQAQQLSSILATTRARAGTTGDGFSVADGGASNVSVLYLEFCFFCCCCCCCCFVLFCFQGQPTNSMGSKLKNHI